MRANPRATSASTVGRIEVAGPLHAPAAREDARPGGDGAAHLIVQVVEDAGVASGPTCVASSHRIADPQRLHGCHEAALEFVGDRRRPR